MEMNFSPLLPGRLGGPHYGKEQIAPFFPDREIKIIWHSSALNSKNRGEDRNHLSHLHAGVLSLVQLIRLF